MESLVDCVKVLDELPRVSAVLHSDNIGLQLGILIPDDSWGIWIEINISEDMSFEEEVVSCCECVVLIYEESSADPIRIGIEKEEIVVWV